MFSFFNIARETSLVKMQYILERIMSKISEFAVAQKAFNARLETSLTGIAGDVKKLNDKITELQNSAGTVTPEDQALLDDLQLQGEALATSLEGLDDLTPPTPPVEPE